MGNSHNIIKTYNDQLDFISDSGGAASSVSDSGGAASSASDSGGAASSASDNLLKFPTLKFNEKIIHPHIEAKSLSSSYRGSVIKGIVYETVYNTIIYNIFLNSVNNDSFFVVSDTVLHNIRKDLIEVATILANSNVDKKLEITEYRKIRHKCQGKKCKGCYECNTANNKIRDYDEQILKYNKDRIMLIKQMISNKDFHKVILERDGNLKKIIEDNKHEKELVRLEKMHIKQEETRREQIRQEQIRQEQIRQEHLQRQKINQERIRREQLWQEQLRQEQLRQEQLRQEQLRQEQLRQEQIIQAQILEYEKIRQAQILEDEKIREARLEASGAGEAKDDAKRSCSICMEDFIRPTTITKCGHVYCYSCIVLTFNTGCKKCPLCNKIFAISDLTILFF